MACTSEVAQLVYALLDVQMQHIMQRAVHMRLGFQDAELHPAEPDLQVALVSFGMCFRAWPGMSASAGPGKAILDSKGLQSNQIAGVACVAFAAFLYSWLGVLYEVSGIEHNRVPLAVQFALHCMPAAAVIALPDATWSHSQ